MSTYEGEIKLPAKAYDARENVFRALLVRKLTEMNTKIIDKALEDHARRNKSA